MGKRDLCQFPFPENLCMQMSIVLELTDAFQEKCIYWFAKATITKCPIARSFNKCSKLLRIKSVIKGQLICFHLRSLLDFYWPFSGFVFT